MTETKKLNLDQIMAAAIMESVGQKLVISPQAVANAPQDCQVKMSLDDKGNFVLKVDEKQDRS